MDFDLTKFSKNYQNYIGTDEVGRGPLAGPVVTCSFMIPNVTSKNEFKQKLQVLKDLGVQDSKMLSSKMRTAILDQLNLNLAINEIGQSKTYHLLVNNLSYQFSISIISSHLIDRINILNATLLSMKRSINTIAKDCLPYILIDGNKIPKDLKYPCEFVIKGDQKSLLIGLASIIAKEWRDQYMIKMSKIYQHFGFEKHSGYPTKLHRESIKEYGIVKIHRKSFNGCKSI